MVKLFRRPKECLTALLNNVTGFQDDPFFFNFNWIVDFRKEICDLNYNL